MYRLGQVVDSLIPDGTDVYAIRYTASAGAIRLFTEMVCDSCFSSYHAEWRYTITVCSTLPLVHSCTCC
jgi:hypothetical protein